MNISLLKSHQKSILDIKLNISFQYVCDKYWKLFGVFVGLQIAGKNATTKNKFQVDDEE